MRVVLPAARVGIFGACVLALGRALGETIAVTMVIGNRPQISASLFAPSYTLASVIANEFTEATTSLYISALIELGLDSLFREHDRQRRRAPDDLERARFGADLLTPWPHRAKDSLRPSWRCDTPGCGAAGSTRCWEPAWRCSARSWPRRCCWRFSVTSWSKASGAINWEFLTQLPHPIGVPGGGVGNGIVGSFIMIGLATAMAMPIGLLTGIYLALFGRGRDSRSVALSLRRAFGSSEHRDRSLCVCRSSRAVQALLRHSRRRLRS